MRIFGPASDKHRYYLLSIFSILAFSIPTNFAAGVQRKARGHSSNQLSINSVGPSSGPKTGGTSVTISGAGFTQSASVAFGGVAAASVIVVSSTQLQAVTSAHASGAVSVSITENPHNQTATLGSGFTYTSSPSSTSIGVSSASPAEGPTSGGTVVTITGKGFQAGAAVAFGSSKSTAVTVAGSTEINAMSPPGSSGTVAITVTNPDAQSASLPSAFTYSSGPSLTSISPNTGPVTGGTTVTILGSGFQSGSRVTFGGIAATSVTLVSSTQVQAVSPVSSAGTVAIAVANPDSQSGTLDSAFTYYHTVGLSWTASSTTASGYNVYRSSTSGGPYIRLNLNLLSSTSFNDNNVQAGQTYFYVTTAVNNSNMESAYSNQAQAVVPSP
jgi:IPT/TIG domain